MAKAVLLLDPDGIPLAPATLCAEEIAEARRLNLPLFDEVLAELSEGKQLRADGNWGYELLQHGKRVGLLEVFKPPLDPPEP